MPQAREGQITLRDGRRLSYAEYGDAAGDPLFYFHGSPGSRLEGELADEAARRHGYRVIAPERPGYGHSTFQPRRRFDDWPDDVAALADALGIGRFALVGLSGGGPHVVACLAALPGRITAAAIVSGAGPVDAYIARSRSRFGRWLRRAWMPASRLAISAGLLVLPFVLRRTSARRMSTFVDRRVLARLDRRAAFRDDVLESFRHGSRGARQEYGLHTRPWPFDARRVAAAVDVWHGDADVIVRIDIGRYVAGLLPAARWRLVAGGGHLMIDDEIGAILAELRGAAETT